MRKLLISCGAALLLAFLTVIPCAAGPCSPDNGEAPGIYVPDRGCFELGVGYEYQHFNVLGTSFGNHDYNINLTMHLFDWLTGAEGRLTVGVEGAMNGGFDGHTTGTPSLDAKSIFGGGGPHLAIVNRSRFEPWVHVLVGVQHFRFTQGPVLGSNSAFGFEAGGGVDIRLASRLSWRVEGDYVGTNFQSTIQSNYGAGTGLVLSF